MEGRRRGRERGLTTAAMVEDKYPHKIHDESTNRYDHQSIMFHLWRLKSSLGKVQDGLLDVTHTSRDNGGSLSAHFNSLRKYEEGNKQEEEGIDEPGNNLSPHIPAHNT